MATSQMITSKKPITDGRYLIPLDMKMTLTVSMLISQMRALKIRRGTTTYVNRPEEKNGSTMTPSPLYRGYPLYLYFSLNVSIIGP